MSKAVTDQHDEAPAAGAWQPLRETAPSRISEDQPQFARFVGMAGLFLVVLATAVFFFTWWGWKPFITTGWAIFFLALGTAALLFHAASDRDVQVRRAYGTFGISLLLLSIVVSLLPIQGAVGNQFGYGFVGMLTALFFLLSFARIETDVTWRKRVVLLLGAAGAAGAVLGLGMSAFRPDFLLPYGLLLSVLGLFYLWAFVSTEGTSSELGYRVGRILGVVGGVIILYALARAILPPLFYSLGWTMTRPGAFFVPGGLVLTVIGVLYLGLSTGLCSERQLVVITRRELASIFFSPVAYIVLFFLSLIGWFLFHQFVWDMYEDAQMAAVLQEPIVTRYFLSWLPVICVTVAVPALTMRLLSEERRTGTFEVLLTAPVEETTVVLSKFLAAYLFFLLLWLPWGLNLISLYVGNRGGIDSTPQPFEYNPLLAFAVVLGCTGANFIAMGLFFSSLTKNQIASFFMTFAGMLLFLMAFLARMNMQSRTQATPNPWATVLGHINYIDPWITSLHQGVLTPQPLIFHLTAAVFWLFLSVKVLEARKWM